MTVHLEILATDGAARTGRLVTRRGTITTPCFMPVGTRAAVKGLDSTDLDALGVQVMLANTYHLMLRPGSAAVAAAGGLHRFMGWDGHILTDSGGYQVFSLDPAVDDDGVTFRSAYDGTSVRFTPEDAVRTQEELGADIQMVLDVCPPLPSPPEVLRQAVERTAAWAARARDAHTRADQALFGIVQGGTDPDLRAESARRTVAIGFDGYGIGGLSVGEPRGELVPALAAAVSEIPERAPRYVMGLGDPSGLVDAIATGADLFDCVLPTRLGRHATALTSHGRLNLKNARFATDDSPIEAGCPCPTCTRYSRAYLRHLAIVHEPTGARLVTIHNLSWTRDLVARAAAAVEAGTLDQLRREVARTWSPEVSGGDPAARVPPRS